MARTSIVQPNLTTRSGPPNRDAVAIAGPSWIVSFTLHVTFLFILAATLRGGGSGISENLAGEPFREVGIYVKPADQLVEHRDDLQDSSDSEKASTAVVSRPQDDAQSSRPVESHPSKLDDGPTSLLDLPTSDRLPVIGSGQAPESQASTGAAELIQSNGVRSSVPSRGAGIGETSFFNIKVQGTRFVYVLDRSGSMGDHNAIGVAKAELMSSLESLDANQQFQAIFYNTTLLEITQSGERRPRLYQATDINRTLARQFIAQIQPDGGTNHMPALRQAMRYTPEHLFLLTDADEPQLSSADLSEIRKLNRGRTQIHCVEFGRGPRLSVDSFLKTLASQNGGTYRYRDVTQF